MCIISTSADGIIPSQLEFAAALPKTLVFHGLVFQFDTLIRAYVSTCWAFDLLITDASQGLPFQQCGVKFIQPHDGVCQQNVVAAMHDFAIVMPQATII